MPDDEGQKRFVQGYVATHAVESPTHPAVSLHDFTLNYAELNILASQIAQFLQSKKIRSGDPIVVIMERTPLLMAVMLGIFRAGGIFVPINPKYPDEKIRFIIEDCATHLILTDNLQRIPEEALFKTTLLNAGMDILRQTALTPLSPLPYDENAIAYIIYTSGTTGTPKGVMIRHRGLMNLSAWYKKYFHVTARDHASQFASQGFDSFFCETIPFFVAGATVHIIDDNTRLTPGLFFSWLTQNKITVCDLPTSYAKVLFSHAWPESHSLRIVKIGGESLTRWPAKILNFDLWNGYGPTEATVETTFACLSKAGDAGDALRKIHTIPPIGKPLDNIQCYIADSHLQEVPDGTAGELLIGGICLSPGYLNRPELTQEKFIPNPFEKNSHEKLYRTGDLVRRHEDGNLEYIGRIDNQVKIRGYRIELSEIESCISGYSDVGEVVVLAKDGENDNKSLVAWLVPKLEKIRIPWQGKCLISTDNEHYHQAITENISKEGLAITGISEELPVNHRIRINLTLPGSNDSIWLQGKTVWHQNGRAGIHFTDTPEQSKILEKCIEYYLSTHNLMETLENAAVRRNLKNALKDRLPEYMIPDTFCILPRMPLTFNGKVDIKALPLPSGGGHLLTKNPVEPSTETEKKLADIWKKILTKTTVSMSDNFFDIGGNSLLVAEFCIQIMEKFNVTLPAGIFFDRPYIPIIAEFIESKGENYTDSSPVQKQIQQDVQLPDDITPGAVSTEKLREPTHILLTGAGGFLGIYLLRYLLAQTEAKIYCLIRKGGFESIASRFSEQIRQFELSDEIDLSNRRIVLVSGDIALHQFNLPLEQYNALSEQIDCIYHCGAQVNIMASYNSLRGSNVIGTQEVIRFATHKKSKAIYYISTLSAACLRDENGRFAENFPGPDHRELAGGYALTKWVSERLLTQCMQRGLPVHIYRSGYIMGDSVYGVTSTNDALLYLIKGCLQLGIAPNWHDLINVLPVDFVSHAIVSLTRQMPDKNTVYHLDHPAGIPWIKLIRWFRKKGYPLRIVSHEKWLRHLAGIDRSNALYAFLPYYLSMTMPPQTPETGLDKTRIALKRTGLKWPEIDDKIMNIYYNFLLQSRFLPEPAAVERNPSV